MNYVPTEVEPLTLTLDDCRKFTEVKDQMRRDLTVHIVRRKILVDPPVPQDSQQKVRRKRIVRRTIDREVEKSQMDK